LLRIEFGLLLFICLGVFILGSFIGRRLFRRAVLLRGLGGRLLLLGFLRWRR
jgi:hypothetical protein